MTPKKRILGFLTLLAASTAGLHAATLVTLTPSSFGRVQDRPTLGANGGGGTDVVNNNAGNLFIGDHSNNNDVYHTAFMYDLGGQDWSFVTPDTTFVLRVQVTGITGGGWSSVKLWHVPAYTPDSVGVSVILGGTSVSSLLTGSVSTGDWLEFDVTSFVKSDISANRDYSIFRLSPETLANNGNAASDYLRLGSDATLTAATAAIPEPAGAAALIGAAAISVPLLRRRRTRWRRAR